MHVHVHVHVCAQCTSTLTPVVVDFCYTQDKAIGILVVQLMYLFSWEKMQVNFLLGLSCLSQMYM